MGIAKMTQRITLILAELEEHPWEIATTLIALLISVVLLVVVSNSGVKSNLKPVTKVDLINSLLDIYKGRIGKDFEGYRGHCYRVFNLVSVAHGKPLSQKQEEMVAIAIAFHDVGLWSHGIDYIDPSVVECRTYLAENPKLVPDAEDRDIIYAMIDNHHKWFFYSENGLVEAFRQADWMDASMGMRTFEALPADVRAMRDFTLFPEAGFYNTLIRFTKENLMMNPFSYPLPMMQIRPRVYNWGVKEIL
ncbi:hypothetical protein HDU98_011680 [Podochytrium sp. JEL0797]|nr:hypothetical protein HDU98_011680 [Podochytrium sp. JEL0797]